MDIMIIIIFIMLFIFMLIGGVALIAYMWCKPFLPYFRAKLDKKDVIFVIGKDNKVRLMPAKYSSGIYTVQTPPYSFLHKEPRAYRFGDLQCVFVHDGWGVTLSPDFAEVIEELKEKGVTSYEELHRRVEGKETNGKPIPEDEKLHHSDIIRIHAFKDIDFGNFLAFVADMTPTEIRSHIDEYIAKFTEDHNKMMSGKPAGGMNMMTWLIIILVIAGGGFFAMKQFGYM